MRFLKTLSMTSLLVASLAGTPPASAIVIGQVDTFEDGTTQNWIVGLLGAVHPAPPVNVPNGGPLGAGDNYLQITSIGGASSGSRLTVMNLVQWAGNYATAGVTAIAMDLRNFSANDLNIRLFLENPLAAPPTDTAISSSILLPAGSGWIHAEFAIDALALTELTGDVDTLLNNVTVLRIFHGPDSAFPGPAVTATLGIDNITAQQTTNISEPPAVTLLVLGLLGLLPWRNTRANTWATSRFAAGC